MTERFDRVVLLLRSWVDLWFEPVTWSGGLRRQSVGGEGPSERIECAGCRGEGLVRERNFQVPCEACGGLRAVPPALGRPGRGWIVVDAYTQRPIGTAETGVSRAVRAVRCDSCGGDGAFGNGRRCGRCGGSGWCEVALDRLRAVRVGPVGAMLDWGPAAPPSVVGALDEGFPGAGRALRERLVAGSYEELGVAMGVLRVTDRSRFRLVNRVYVGGLVEPEELGVRDGRLLRDGLGFVVVRMPEVIRVPGWAARNERRRRDRLKRRVAA